MTPAHLWNTIYKDIPTDVIYATGNHYNLNVNDTVQLPDNMSGTVTSISLHGFMIQPSNPIEQAEGLSGMPVLNQYNETVGYISTQYKGGYIYCIWS